MSDVPTSPEGLWQLAAHAQRAAAVAAEHIRSRRPHSIEHKETGGDYVASQVVTEVDRQAEALIVQTLQPALEGLGLLTEERPDDGSRLRAPAFWCIDPLDGTLAYIRGERGPAVSVGLVRRDGVPLIGVIVDVVTGQRIAGVRGGGVAVDGTPWRHGAPSGSLRVFGDHSFEDKPAYRSVTDRLGAADVHVGQAAVLNAWSVLASPPAVYFKFPRTGRGGGSLWDYAATACCFGEAGCVATTFAGDPLPLNRPDTTFLADCGVMFASDSGLAAQVRSAAASPP
ncbi:MAG: inositol monophosphatase family protein [Nannocystaceae bacterium]|nr:inositol monophosphatase [bacterium]